MEDATQTIIGDIQQKIQGYLAEIAKLKKTANAVADLAGLGPIYADAEDDVSAAGPNRADAYYGKPLATAVREYLEFRRQAVPVEDIMKGLEQGGFDFSSLDWPANGRLRFLAISISKNTPVFHRLPNGMWGLNAWYPEATQKRRAKSKGKGNGPEPKDAAMSTTQPEPVADAKTTAKSGKKEKDATAPVAVEKEKGSAAETTEPTSNE